MFKESFYKVIAAALFGSRRRLSTWLFTTELDTLNGTTRQYREDCKP